MRDFGIASASRLLLLALLGAALAACGQLESGGSISPAALPLSKQAVSLMTQKGMGSSSPIFIRIFKKESELEVWKARDDGHFYHFKTYPICNWSGDLGPKLATGDKQAPEGFYTITSNQMNPNSAYHLSFNIGFPNAYDRAHGATGSALMVHGDCKSAGCYAVTDALVEEIYGLVRDALAGGQTSIALHAFPFRMTELNMKAHKDNKWFSFWRQMKQGYDSFEISRQPPPVAVCSKRYLVNAKFGSGAEVDADAPCPPFTRIKPQTWLAEEQPDPAVLVTQVKVQGKKLRTPAIEPAVQTDGGWGAAVKPGKMGLGKPAN